jgi:hypothetical protein
MALPGTLRAFDDLRDGDTAEIMRRADPDAVVVPERCAGERARR